MNKGKSLKKEILQFLIVFSIFVVFSLGIFSSVNLYNSKIEIIEHHQNLVLKQASKEVSTLIDNISDIGKYISSNYLLDPQVIKNIVEINKNISSILILNDQGKIENFFALENLNMYKGFDYSNQNYFKNINLTQQEYWSNVFLSTVDEEPSISYSFKMQDKIGVIMIKLTNLSKFLERFKNVDNTHMIRIFDKNGVMIINPDAKEYVLQRFNAVTSEVYTKLINNEKTYQQVIFSSIRKNGKQYGAYSTIDKTGWSIVVRESHDLILQSLNSILIGMALAILMFIVIAVYISLKISKRIFKSFDDLEETTSEIANGNYDIEVKKSYYNEFNKLLKSFNKMQIKIDKREDTLENSLNSFKFLFNSTMESIILHNNGKCIDINDVTLTLLKLDSKDDLVGGDILDFVDIEYKKYVKEQFLKNTEPYEVVLVRKDGTKINALVQGKLLELNGEIIRVSALIDITEMKHKEQLLFQQSKMASMGEMIGNIAHQWRQPLSIISTSASGAKIEKELQGIKDTRLFSSLDAIVDNTQYLSKTIDDFRNFFISNQNSEHFLLDSVIEKSLTLVQASLKNHYINVTTSLEKNLKVLGHENKFLQVLINLINNSKDAFILTKKDERCIEIKCYKRDQKLVVEINDNAGGISLHIIKSIFDPYFTTKHKSKGTGIGLYMSHQIIVDHMGGDLIAKNSEMLCNSRKEKGATFIIELPIKSDFTK